MSRPPSYFKQIEVGPMQNFVYLVGDSASREAAIVDPGWEVPRLLRVLEQDGYRPTKAFITHGHFDHVMGLGELLSTVDIPVYLHQAERAALHVEAPRLQLLRGGETVHVGSVPVTAIHTPGHTPGSQCLLVDGRLLSGDTLFIGACGRCDLPGGDPAALYESLTKTIKRLDDEILLCPGHNYADVPVTRLGDEKRTNPFLASPSLHEFLRLVRAA